MGESFRLQFLQSLSALIISAFGLVAALAWNETIKAAVAAVFDSGDDLIGLFIYAMLVTVLAVAATMIITRATNKAKADLEKGEQKKADKKAAKEEKPADKKEEEKKE